MSDQNSNPSPAPEKPTPLPAVAVFGVLPAAPPRSEVARIIIGTLGPISAKLAFAWLALLATLAVTAPLIASSHPILLKLKGKGWTSPMLQSLTPADTLILVAVAAAAITLCFRRWTLWRRLGVVLVVVLIAAWPAFHFCKQPENIIYDQYRSWQQEGKVEAVHYTLIPYSPSDRLRDQFNPDDPHPRAPSKAHLCGTDSNGSDVLSRSIHACRVALTVGFVSTGIAVFLGVLIGGLMGYYSGVVDLLGMRLVEVFGSIPSLYLILAIVAFWGSGTKALFMIMVVIGLLSWPGYAIFIRAEFLKLRQQNFVEAAIAGGLPLRSVLFRHMLPNGITPVLVSASFGIAGAMNVENILSFLGIGQLEEPSFGSLLNQATNNGQFAWWLAIYPGGALTFSMFAFVLIGEAMRDVIDPYTASKK